MGHISGGGGLLEQLVFSIRAALVSDAVKVRKIEMLTARTYILLRSFWKSPAKGKVLTAGCEVEAFP